MNKTLTIIIFLTLVFCFNDIYAQRNRKAERRARRAATIQSEQKENKARTSQQEVKTNVENVEVSRQNESFEVKEVINIEQLEKLATPIISEKTNGSVNWSQQYIEAKGSSVIDNSRFTNPAQAKAMATRGAIVVAQRNLLEIIQGVNVTSETTVNDMITKSDFIYTRVDGVIKGAVQHGPAIEKDGMIEVTLRIPMYDKNGLAPALIDEANKLPELNLKRSPSQNTAATENIKLPEGLVFDFGGKTFDPAMFPVILDPNGKLLLDLSKIYDVKTGKFPKILSGTKEIFNDLNFKEGTEIIKVIESYNGKIVIDKESTQKINWEKIQKGLTTASKIFKFILTLI